MRETTVSLDDLVMPLFVAPEALAERARCRRWRATPSTRVVREGEELVRVGVRRVILFGIPEEKDDEGSGAWIDDGIVQQALRALRPRFPELLLLTDVCLCEYTSHGHCGVIARRRGRQRRVARAARADRRLARRGGRRRRRAERHDGRARRGDPRASCRQTPIIAYSAKYASAFYGPFRDVADSAPAFGDRRGYQMDPGNVREALRECEQDVAEGADVLMVKPALPYLDVICARRATGSTCRSPRTTSAASTR